MEGVSDALLVRLSGWILRVGVDAFGQHGQRRIEPRLPAQDVNGLEPARRDQPSPRIRRHALPRPLLHSRGERIMKRLLSELKVAEQSNERRKYAPTLSAVDRIDRIADLLGTVSG